MDNIQRIISEQVLSWSRREAKAKQRRESAGTWPVITISREFGAGGRSLANELDKRTGFKVWDRELLTAITEKTGADERFLASLDERRRTLIDDTLYGTFMGAKHSNTHYIRSLLRIVHTIGAHGKSIIVGRGGGYILGSGAALRVRIVCPLESRIAHIAEKEDIPGKDAEEMIKARDAERKDFIRFYFKKESIRPEDFDMVLNSGVFNLGQMADLTLKAYEEKFGKDPT